MALWGESKDVPRREYIVVLCCGVMAWGTVKLPMPMLGEEALDSFGYSRCWHIAGCACVRVTLGTPIETLHIGV
jgi:hypothetical protein